MPSRAVTAYVLLTWSCLFLAACGVAPRPSAQPSVLASSAGDAGQPASSNVDIADTGWQPIGTAMELRTVRLGPTPTSAPITAVRFDPAAYKISVKYDVNNAGYLREWFNALKPVAVMNGGYFDEQGKPTALVIFDGVRRGESYQGFGGMVVINPQGEFELRSLRQQPFDPNENLQQAMQSAPMLIQPGGEVSAIETDQERSRRSVIARDKQGRLLLIVSNAATFTLAELAQALKRSDLELDAALNLDGGRSTGLYVETASQRVTIDSYEKLPLVLVVEKRRG